MPDSINEDVREALRGIALGEPAEFELRTLGPGLGAAATLGALIALDAPPAAYVRQLSAALAAGLTVDDILGVLATVTPHVGIPRATAAAAEIMVALGLPLDEST